MQFDGIMHSRRLCGLLTQPARVVETFGTTTAVYVRTKQRVWLRERARKKSSFLPSSSPFLDAHHRRSLSRLEKKRSEFHFSVRAFPSHVSGRQHHYYHHHHHHYHRHHQLLTISRSVRYRPSPAKGHRLRRKDCQPPCR